MTLTSDPVSQVPLDGDVTFDISVSDTGGQPLDGVAVLAWLENPVDPNVPTWLQYNTSDPVPVVGGVAQVVVPGSELGYGTHGVVARFVNLADMSTLGVSGPVSVEVDRTSTDISVSRIAGVGATLNATVSPSGVSGTVKFFEQGVEEMLGSAEVVNGSVSIDNPFSSPGVRNIFVVYSGDDFHEANTSAVVAVHVDPATTVTLRGPPGASSEGDVVEFEATVAPSDPGLADLAPSGSIIFSVDGTAVEAVDVDEHGVAAWVTDSLEVGDHVIAAEFVPDTPWGTAESSLGHDVGVRASVAISSNVAAATWWPEERSNSFGSERLVLAGSPFQVRTFVIAETEDATSRPGELTASIGGATYTETPGRWLPNCVWSSVCVSDAGIGIFVRESTIDITGAVQAGSHDLVLGYDVAGGAGGVTRTVPVTAADDTVVTGELWTPTVNGNDWIFVTANVSSPTSPAPSGKAILSWSPTGWSPLVSGPTVDVVDGQATFNVPADFLGAGQYDLRVLFFDPSGTVAPGASTPMAVTAGKGTPQVEVASNAAGNSGPLVATVTGRYNSAPTGPVSFYLGDGTLLGSADLESAESGTPTATASLAAALSGPGPVVVYASYGGDDNYVPADSDTRSVLVDPASVTTLTANPSPSLQLGTVTLTATVAPVDPGVTVVPGGFVDFFVDGTPVGSKQLNGSGTAVLQTSLPDVGSTEIEARYRTGGGFIPSSDVITHQVVQRNESVVTVVSSPAFPALGEPVTLTATVTGAGATPGGTIVFYPGTEDHIAMPLAEGTVSVTVSTLRFGSNTIGVSYGGDATYLPSNGSTVVNVVSGETRINADIPTDVAYGDPLGVEASLVYGPDDIPVLWGSVSVSVDGTEAAQVPVIGGAISTTVTGLGAGGHEVTMSYSGSATLASASAGPFGVPSGVSPQPWLSKLPRS
ncbi:MAG: Ig-like domain-containing protein [Microthrixaceae bacterium]